jgi:hypothetical protein
MYVYMYIKASLRLAELDLLLIAMHIDGSIRINPTDAVIDAATVLFAVAGDEDSLSPVCKHKHCRVSDWIGQFQANRKAGGHAARQRAKHIKLQSPEALAKVFAASANPNFAQQDKLQSSTLLNQNPDEPERLETFIEKSVGSSFFEKPHHSTHEFSDQDIPNGSFRFSPNHQGFSNGDGHVNEHGQGQVRSRAPMLGELHGGGFHSPHSHRRDHVKQPMTAAERRSSFGTRDVRALMKSTKKELIAKFKRESKPDSNLERLMNVVEQGGHTVLLMMMDDDKKDLEVSTLSPSTSLSYLSTRVVPHYYHFFAFFFAFFSTSQNIYLFYY